MNTYDVGVRRKLRTSATRRWLVVSVYDGRPKVETSTDDEEAAAALIVRYRRKFGPGCRLVLIDQAGKGRAVTHFITVYDEAGLDQLVNVAHIVRIAHGSGNPPVLHLTNGAIRVTSTPAVPVGSHESGHYDRVHQDIIDMLTATIERNP